MRKQVLAGVTALALAAGTTTSAMAFSHGGGHAGGWGGHVGAVHSFGGTHTFAGNRFAGVRGFNSFRHGGWGGRRFVGGWGYGGWGYPYDAYAADVGIIGLGIGLADVATGYCDPYAYGWGWGAGYCGYGYYGYGTPIDAWSW
jgi:hypothetical protein